MRTWILAAAAAAALASAGAAQAAIITYSWDVTGAAPTPYTIAGTTPFGLSANPEITGSVQIDTTLGLQPPASNGSYYADASAFVSITYTTGSRTWTLADLVSDSLVGYTAGGQLAQVFIDLAPGGDTSSPEFSLISAFDSFGLGDAGGLILCQGCVSGGDSITGGGPGGDLPGSVPEPATWALLIAGFAGLGAQLRKRRAVVA